MKFEAPLELMERIGEDGDAAKAFVDDALAVLSGRFAIDDPVPRPDGRIDASDDGAGARLDTSVGFLGVSRRRSRAVRGV